MLFDSWLIVLAYRERSCIWNQAWVSHIVNVLLLKSARCSLFLCQYAQTQPNTLISVHRWLGCWGSTLKFCQFYDSHQTKYNLISKVPHPYFKVSSFSFCLYIIIVFPYNLLLVNLFLLLFSRNLNFSQGQQKIYHYLQYYSCHRSEVCHFLILCQLSKIFHCSALLNYLARFQF
jgi:hypothetical protein